MMTIRSLMVVGALAALLGGAAFGWQDEGEAKDEALTLERIFPEKSFFGPGARSVEFSRDGRFAAFLYRPYAERRHGSDLYIYDTETGQCRRITSVGRMSEYQESTREVRDDREKKAKAAKVTLIDLATEQRARLGLEPVGAWGEWEGKAETPQRDGALRSGDCALDLDAKLNGELRIGLVRLPVSKGSFETGVLTATVKDEKLGVDGKLELTLAAGEMSGTLTLEEPKQTLRISLTRSDGDDDGDNGPVGVIGALGERLTLGDVVLDDDATINDDEEEEEEEQQQRGMRERERAPRYGGVSSYEWSPTVNEMLLSSEGDVYRLQIDEEKWDAPIDDEGDGKAPVEVYRGDLTRLTRTRDPEFSVQFLPDGTGYTYLRSGALIRVGFEGSMIEQLDPELEDGEEMVDYAISPDGKRLVFLASRGGNFWGVGRTVNIVNYRDRFAQVRQVPRHMPDDPFPEAYSSVYLYDLDGHDREEGTLKRVFTRRVSGPRDIMDVPHWAPDSTKVAFAAFDQASGLVKVMEAGFEEMEEDKDAGADDEAAPDDAEDADTEKDDTEKNDTEKDDTEKDDTEKDDDVDDEEKAEGDESAEEPEQPDFEIVDARVVYQFLHAGGPNTPGMVVPQYLPDSLRMVLITELSGFRQLHVLDPRYEQLSQLTEGRFEVYPFDLSEDHTTLFATATMDDPAQEHVFKIDLENGELTRLSVEEGVYASVGVSDDGAALLAMRSDFGAPSELVAVDGAAQSTTTLTDSHPEEAHKLTTVSPEYFTFDNRHGLQIHGHMFKPEDWTPEDKRPLLIYVYGGPLGERKMATRGSYSAPSYYFARYMTEVHGWVTATIDPRGASGYGAVFEKANFEQVGKPQTEDLVDGAKWLVEHAGVDPAKKALHGWSFGGFQTQMVMYTEPDAFAVGIAGAGPTEWHNYNSWYSTGTIGPNQPGKTDLEEYSLLPLAKNLKGKLLLVHGVEDSNVLYQDTMRVYRELLKAGKETLVELFIDPTGGHGLGGDVKTFNRYHKYEDFLLRNLGKGASAAEPEEGDEEKDEPDEDE